MTRRVRWCAAFAWVPLVLLLAAEAPAQSIFKDDPAARFTAEQAARGQTLYARSCVNCHGATLEGTQFGPPLKGAAFEGHWQGRPQAAFSQQLRTTMPPGGLGSMSSEAYAEIEAYILQENGGIASANAPSTPAPVSAQAQTPVPVSAQAQTPVPVSAQPQVRAVSSSEAEAPRAPPPPPVKRGENEPLYLAAINARATKAAAVTPVTDAMLKQPSPADWLIWRRTYDGFGYSPLRQINRSNVRRLRTAWSWSLPESGNEITPLVHDGVMFVSSGPAVQALDAATGELLWQYLRTLPNELNNGRSSRVKALAIYGDKLFTPTADGHVIALDVRTGRLVWDQAVTNSADAVKNGRPANTGLQMNGGPIVAKGKVIIGVSLGLANGGGCFIVGLDAESGKESWRFHTIARPGQPGGDSWNGAPVEERFGGGVWTAGSYDPELDLVYFGIANTYNAATLLEPRPGAAGVSNNDGLYTNATVALRPDTGALAWHYQHHKRDVWDMDWVFEQTVTTLRVDGHPKKLVVTGGKLGIFDAVDAATGAFVFSKDLGQQNLVMAIDPITGEKTSNPAIEPEAGKPKFVCPSNFGVRNWLATALNPDTRILYIPMAESCADYLYTPRSAAQTAAGGIDMRFTPRTPPGHDGNYGRLAALDLQSQKVVWTHRQRMPVASSALATAGGVLFNGDLDRYFYAFDQATGKILWRTRLNAAPESSPVTYTANGHQYVAVVTGGGTALGANSRGSVPELQTPAAGVTVVVFELP